MEKKIDEIQEVGSGFLDTTQRILEVVANALKPGIDAAGPILKQAGEQASKIASPAISEASKTAEEAIQSSGLDTAPILNAAKVFRFLWLYFSFIVQYIFAIQPLGFSEIHNLGLYGIYVLDLGFAEWNVGHWVQYCIDEKYWKNELLLALPCIAADNRGPKHSIHMQLV